MKIDNRGKKYEKQERVRETPSKRCPKCNGPANRFGWKHQGNCEFYGENRETVKTV